MQIHNQTKNCVITSDAVVATTLWQHFMGLRFRNSTAGMLFKLPWEQKVLLDMIFMKFPIDVVYIRKGEVVELKENLKIWGFYRNKKKASHILELKSGEIKNKKIEIGDKIKLTPNN